MNVEKMNLYIIFTELYKLWYKLTQHSSVKVEIPNLNSFYNSRQNSWQSLAKKGMKKHPLRFAF